MSDLVQRLRTAHRRWSCKMWAGGQQPEPDSCAALCREAADEIERLRSVCIKQFDISLDQDLEIKQLRTRQRGDEDQLVRIANFLGGDARQAPESDPTIAGLVIAEIKRLRALHAEVVGELYGKGFEVAGWHHNGDLEPLDSFFEDSGWLDADTWQPSEKTTEKARKECPHIES